MRRSLLPCFAAAAALVIVLAGCGSTSASRKGLYRSSVGSSTNTDVVNETRDALLNQFGYQLSRSVTTSEEIRFITYWREQEPLEDESEQGIANTRHRITVRASPKNRTAQTYSVTFRAENEVQLHGNAAWQKAEMTEMREEYFDEVAEYLQNEIGAGVRSY